VTESSRICVNAPWKGCKRELLMEVCADSSAGVRDKLCPENPSNGLRRERTKKPRDSTEVDAWEFSHKSLEIRSFGQPAARSAAGGRKDSLKTHCVQNRLTYEIRQDYRQCPHDAQGGFFVGWVGSLLRSIDRRFFSLRLFLDALARVNWILIMEAFVEMTCGMICGAILLWSLFR